MAVYRNHKDLVVWQKSIELVKQVYVVTRSFPSDEVYGIVAQMRRAAVSVPSNIAEGYGRKSPKELHRFLSIALGSAAEIETQLIICKEVGYLDEVKYQSLANDIEEIIRMLIALVNTIKSAQELL